MPIQKIKPLRVLHVLGAMNIGGVETWLMQMLRHIDREKFQVDVLVHTDRDAVYDEQLLALGSRILRCPHSANPLLYSRRFLGLIRRYGPFDVLHSHVHYFSGFVLTLGRIAGIPVRIAHSHSDTTTEEASVGPIRTAYLRAMRCFILANCTRGFAVSEPAAGALFGQEWRKDRRLCVIHCGIDLSPFRNSIDPAAARAEFGFGPDDVVFGHVGRFIPVKNHLFLLDVADCIRSSEPRAKFLFLGDGPLRRDVERQAVALGLKDKIVFAGLRLDVPRLMAGAIDVFIMPSLQEGLPLVLIEAQAASLRCVASDVITEEAVLNPAIVRRMPLSSGVREWARVAVEQSTHPKFDRSRTLAMFTDSSFDIRVSVSRACGVYLENDVSVRRGHS